MFGKSGSKSLSGFTSAAADRLPTDSIDVGDVRDRVSDGLSVARDQLAGARDALAPRAEAARDALGPRLAPVREQVGAAASTAADHVGPVVDSARQHLRDDVAPAIAAAVENALEASAPARQEAKVRAEAALSAIKGDAVVPARRRRWPIVLLGFGLGTAIGVVVSRLVQQPQPTPYQPSPGPISMTRGTAAGEQDAAGSPTIEPSGDR